MRLVQEMPASAWGGQQNTLRTCGSASTRGIIVGRARRRLQTQEDAAIERELGGVERLEGVLLSAPFGNHDVLCLHAPATASATEAGERQ